MNLINQVHEEVEQDWEQYENSPNRNNEEAPPQSYEKLVGVIQEVCHRASNDSFIFPVTTLLPEICRYAIEHAQDNRIGADQNWPVILFLQLGVSHDLLVRILETMFEGQDVPFRGAGRLRVVEWIAYAVHDWARQLARAGRADRALEPWVSELIAECEAFAQNPPRSQNEGGLPPQELLREVREVKKTVEGLGGLGIGSFRGSMGFL